MDFVCRSLRIPRPTYLDIGTNDPVRMNNTYFFYKRGCTGVLVEPNPALCSRIRRKRKRDLCLNVGIGTGSESRADFYEMTDSTLSTFSREAALRFESFGSRRIHRVLKIDLLSANTILERHFPRAPDILSLDIEEMDFAVLKSMDFGRHRPKIICVETLTYSENNTGRKQDNIIELLKGNRYRVYADTHINTIFVDDRALGGGSPRSA